MKTSGRGAIGVQIAGERGDRGLSAQRVTNPILWLAHANKVEGPARQSQLNAIGYRVVWRNWSSPEISRAKGEPPAAVVIDLSKTPSVGRDTAIAMRSHRALLPVPFLLVGGNPEAVDKVRKFLPDVIESDWNTIKADLRTALTRPPSGARLLSVFAAYEGAPLVKKLGIKEGSRVALRDAPAGIRSTIGEMPEGAKLLSDRGGPRELTLWFVHSYESLAAEIANMKQHARSGALWIFWRKNQSKDAGARLTQQMVRKAGMDSRLVDFKITRLDDEWAGLRFTIKR